jgi:glucosamine-6-phosphate deaminase
MNVRVLPTKDEAGRAAAAAGLPLIQKAIAERGHARIIVATGASQFPVFDGLAAAGLDWSRVTAFHLDEYKGLPLSHKASFRGYLKQRFADRLSPPLQAMHYISGEDDCQAECRRVGALLTEEPIDVAFVGIGENAHLAFNDPPADFETDEPYIVVDLDEACRRQQVNEGWFPSLADVPKEAISMSIRQILKSRVIICTVPSPQKAVAVRLSIEGAVTPNVPASILQTHHDTVIYLDRDSAAQLRGHADADA